MKKNDYFYEIEKVYFEKKYDIEKRLKEFKEVWEKGSNKERKTLERKMINRRKPAETASHRPIIMKKSIISISSLHNLVYPQNVRKIL